MRAAIDWSPLADQDPVPGDPDEVARLARRYGDTAASILRQASNLRRLASDTGQGWDADAGRAFASHAEGLADRLGKAHDRYAAAAAALGGWVGPLREAQFEASAALTQAQAADAEMQANQPSALTGMAPFGMPMSPVEQQQEHVRQVAYDAAASDLATARARLRAAVADYQRTAQRLAHSLRQAIDHDGLRDTFMDEVGGWIHSHAKGISKTMKILSYVATALAVVSLVIPGLDVLAGGFLLADIFSGTATLAIGMMTAGHAILALTGNGSWVDVGLDIIALGTLGISTRFLTGAKVTVSVAEEAAAEMAASRAVEAATESDAARISFYSDVIDHFPGKGELMDAQSHLDDMASQASAAGEQARERILDLPEVKTRLLTRLRYGERGWAAEIEKLRRLDQEVPGVPEVQDAISSVGHTANRIALANYGALSVDAANHLAEDVFKVKDRISARTTMPLVHLPQGG